MISSRALRQIAKSGPDPISIDRSGAPLEMEGLPNEPPIPALVVAVVTEAVKQVEAEMVVRSVDRDALWAVMGFLLDRRVVSMLTDDVESVAGLIRAVRDAGFDWHAVCPAPPESPSS